jgi:hypothetical protein
MKILIITSGLAILVMVGLFVHYTRPWLSDRDYYIALAREGGASCLTRSRCQATEGRIETALADPPLSPSSRCGDPQSFKVLFAVADRSSASVVLQCNDNEGYLINFAGSNRYGISGWTTGYWMRCSDPTCHASYRAMPAVVG